MERMGFSLLDPAEIARVSGAGGASAPQPASGIPPMHDPMPPNQNSPDFVPWFWRNVDRLDLRHPD